VLSFAQLGEAKGQRIVTTPAPFNRVSIIRSLSAPPTSPAPPHVPLGPAASPVSHIGARPVERSVPNLLTALRVVLAIAFFAVLSPWKYSASPLAAGSGPDPWLLAAAGLFVVAALTDALDGYLARRWNAVSTFGRIMDPFADKLLVIGAFVFLAGPGFTHIGNAILHLPNKPTPPSTISGSVTGVQAWMVAVILGRELLVTSIRAEAEGKGISFAASWSGKWKMILQCICVPGVLLLMNVPGPAGQRPSDPASYAILALVWTTVGVTALSAVPYVARALRVLGRQVDRP
jgi:CDP-diacylglycerol---glycerol-3-phosphate 3-phosphatidyltransferase